MPWEVRDITPFEWEAVLGCSGWGVAEEPPLVGDWTGGPNDPEEWSKLGGCEGYSLIGGSERITLLRWGDQYREWAMEGFEQGNRVVCRHLMEGVTADLATTPLEEVMQKWGFVQVN